MTMRVMNSQDPPLETLMGNQCTCHGKEPNNLEVCASPITVKIRNEKPFNYLNTKRHLSFAQKTHYVYYKNISVEELISQY